ncbi:MAG: GNAT family N-acetyltransferase [Patescibacteria group bacterium]
MDVSKATEADINAILKLQTQIYRTEKIADGAKAALAKQLKDDTCDVLVAKTNDQVMATAVLYYVAVAIRNSHYALLEGLVVDKSQRGKGVGTEFFKKCIETAKEKGCYKIIFTSGSDRTDAHKFYEKNGFVKWGLEFRMDL